MQKNIFLVVGVLVISLIGLVTYTYSTRQDITGGLCGDSVCNKSVDESDICVQDCEVSFEADTKNTYWVTNPASGAKLFVTVVEPASAQQDSTFPALVLVPGSSGDSSNFVGGSKDAQVVADEGFAIVLFDPDGRGRSEGTEDYNGFIGQDGLAAVISFAAQLPIVDEEQIGVVSFSYGITMAAGTLARYPDLPVQFLIDWEGPADRDDTGGCDDSHTGHLSDVASCDDEEFWAEREAVTFIKDIRVPYQRIQTEKDHAQPDLHHAVIMINAGVEDEAPWVRLNDEEPDQSYEESDLPQMLSENFSKNLMEGVTKYAKELLVLDIAN